MYVLFFGASIISEYLFATDDFNYLMKLLSVCVPFIGIQRIFNGVINGLSAYKKLAKIELISYLVSSLFSVVFLFTYNLDGVLKEYIKFSSLKFNYSFFYKFTRSYHDVVLLYDSIELC